MPRCLLCLEDFAQLTDEHIIPFALGGNLYLPESTCEQCQRRCNQSFEHKFLKGTNFIALIRAYLGIRGRHDEPIYGFNRHGEPLTILVQQGFPEIRVGIAANKVDIRPQVILLDANRRTLDWIALPDKIDRPIRSAFFEIAVPTVPAAAKFAALWIDGDTAFVNIWREILDAFVGWAQAKGLAASVSSATAQNASINFRTPDMGGRVYAPPGA